MARGQRSAKHLNIEALRVCRLGVKHRPIRICNRRYFGTIRKVPYFSTDLMSTLAITVFDCSKSIFKKALYVFQGLDDMQRNIVECVTKNPT